MGLSQNLKKAVMFYQSQNRAKELPGSRLKKAAHLQLD